MIELEDSSEGSTGQPVGPPGRHHADGGPPGFCPRHLTFDSACLGCHAYEQERVEWLRDQIEAERAQSLPEEIDTDTAVVLGPGVLVSRTKDHPRENSHEQGEQTKTVVLEPPGPSRVQDHTGTGPGPVRDRADHPLGARYFDVAALLEGTLPEPPSPTYGLRTDAHALIYASEVNLVFGDPEGGKTWFALAAAREVLGEHGDGRVLILDLDHNGPAATVTRLLSMGAALAALSDRSRFLYVEPEDRLHIHAVVEDMKVWQPHIVVLDSLGELLPMFGSSSNSADEYTSAHSAVLKPLAKTGAAVIAIDHLAKGSDSRTLGPGGTTAKRRTVGGVSLRVRVKDAFTPGKGGSAYLTVNKDRHGGVRHHCPTGDREPLAGVFELKPTADSRLEPIIHAPENGQSAPADFTIGARDPARLSDDVAKLSALETPPTSKRDVQDRMGWGSDRAAEALRAWREANG